MKKALKLLQGCLVVAGIGLVALVLMMVSFRMAGPIDEKETSADLEQRVTTVTPEQLDAEGLVPGESRAGRMLSANIFLEEGEFFIKPGPPGSAIRVEGDYDAGSYDLQQELTEGADGVPIYNLSFRAKYSIITRLLRSGFEGVDHENHLTVYLPRDLPLSLNAQIRKGESELELGGLSIRTARLDLEMGEHSVRVSEANPIPMEDLEVRSGMGEIKMWDVGRLGAGKITFWGKMGEVDLDLGGEILRDTKLYARMRMGEMTIGIPRNSEVNLRDSVFLGEKGDIPPGWGKTGEYKLDIDVGMTMGELKYSFR
jgi:hypothetical protein